MNKPLRYPHDLTGMVFGQWTVIEQDPLTEAAVVAREVRWLCRCTCGREHSVSRRRLVQGVATRCKRCAFSAPPDRVVRCEDLTGRTFGAWLVIGVSHRTERNLYWVCRCACGRQGPVRGDSLRTGKSFGCSSCSARRRVRSNKGDREGS